MLLHLSCIHVTYCPVIDKHIRINYGQCCRFLGSSLISGEGLVSVGVASNAAQEEITRIHRENVQRLSGFSEEEILKEKERIQQTIGMPISCSRKIWQFGSMPFNCQIKIHDIHCTL